MKNNGKTDFYKNLSIKKLKQKVIEIKTQLPEEEQNVITYSKNFTISMILLINITVTLLQTQSLTCFFSRFWMKIF